VVTVVTVWLDPTDETLVENVTNMRHGSIEQVVRGEIQSNLESLSYVKRLSVWAEQPKEHIPMTVKFIPNDKGSPAGKLADAELHFRGGPLDGLKLIGFAIWERRTGGRNVTFPARQYTVNGERRSFALLRPTVDTVHQERLRDIILDAFKEHETALAEAEA
jgi:hypothetical protein